MLSARHGDKIVGWVCTTTGKVGENFTFIVCGSEKTYPKFPTELEAQEALNSELGVECSFTIVNLS